MGIRRVVTGHLSNGKGIIASDEVVEPVTSPLAPGSELYRLWGADEPVELPDGGERPAHVTYFPPVGGFRFGVFTVPPDNTTPPEVGDLDVEAEAARRGIVTNRDALVDLSDRLGVPSRPDPSAGTRRNRRWTGPQLDLLAAAYQLRDRHGLAIDTIAGLLTGQRSPDQLIDELTTTLQSLQRAAAA